MSRKERRTAARLQKDIIRRGGKINFGRNYDQGRRNFLKLGLLGAGVILTGGAAAYVVTEGLGGTDSDKDVIFSDIDALGIRPSLKEDTLWMTSYNDTAAHTPPASAAEQTIKDRIYGTLDKMSVSENPHFKSASLDLAELVKSKRVGMGAADLGGASAGITWHIGQEGQFQYQFYADINYLLNESSALTAACVFTHEVFHVKRFEEFLSQFPNLTPQEQLSKMSRFQNYQGNIDEEVLAYGKQSEAYIYEVGLLGRMFGVEKTGNDERAAHFIRYGKDVNSPEWNKYIRRILSRTS